MIKRTSLAKSFWLIYVQLYTQPYINRTFIIPVSVVHFSGKRVLKAMVLKMAPEDPFLQVFMPLCGFLPHFIKVGLYDQGNPVDVIIYYF